MNFFKQLFGRKQPLGEFNDNESSHDLFVNIKKEGKRFLRLPTEDILKKEDKANYEEKRQQFVLVITSPSVDEMDLLTFRLVRINEEATIVCRLDNALISRMADGFSCDIAVKTVTEYGFPLLKFIIFWDFSDGTTQEMEQILNIEWMDVQEFFNACIHTKKLFIHGILCEQDGDSVSKFVVTIISSEERNKAILDEIEMAIDAYDKGVENSFEAAKAMASKQGRMS